MNRRIITLVFILCLIIAALPASVLATSTPMLTWGTVTLDGAAAPVGTTVDVYVGADTTPSGSGTVTTAGQYGAIEVWSDDSRFGEALTYRVNGFIADKLGPDAGVFDLPNQEVNLEAVHYIGKSFIGDPRSCASTPCCVTFTNLTTGGTKPYKSATWDFGDGTDPVTLVANPMADVTHTYAIPGIFDITLTMKDANDVVAFQVELDYIEVGEGGEPPVDYKTWSFSFDGFVPRCLPDGYQGTTYLADLDPASIPACVQGVYYEDGTFWAPGAPGTTLAYLGGDQDPLCYSIAVIPTPCSWTIPLMP